MALEAALQLLPVKRKLQILDLGPPLGANIAFFGRFRCRLYIRQLEEELQFNGSGEAGLPSLQELAGTSEQSPSFRFDLILAWDLLDYMSSAATEGLIRSAAPSLERGSLLLALVNTAREIPSRPLHFRILDERSLSYERRGGEPGPGPRRTQAELLECLPGFRVKRSFLLQNGMQEYLFQFG